jgi:hypothetical protein
MSARQKIAVVAILAGALADFYQYAVIRRQAIQTADLVGKTAGWEEKLRHLRRDQTAAMSRLAAAQAENEQLEESRAGTSADALADGVVQPWLTRVRQLRQRLEDHPELKIPELRLASEQDWLDVARADLSSDEDYRQALAKLRQSATGKFTEIAARALKKYSADNNGQFPTGLSQLQPYFDDPADAAMLRRYAIIPENQIPFIKTGDDQIITQNSQVDQKYDSYSFLTAGGGGGSFSPQAPVNSLLNVLNAFMAANQGQPPGDPTQLLPYAKTPEQQAVVGKAIRHAIKPSLTIVH